MLEIPGGRERGGRREGEGRKEGGREKLIQAFVGPNNLARFEDTANLPGH